MKVKKERNFFEMKSELDILNFGGHDYLLSASALQIDDNLFQSQFNILGKTKEMHKLFIYIEVHYHHYLYAYNSYLISSGFSLIFGNR